MFRGIAEDQVVEDLVVEEVVVHQERTIMQQDSTTLLSSPTSTTTENKEEEEVISTNDQTSQDSSSPNGCPLSFNDEDVVSVIINQTATTNTVMKASLNNNNTINNHHHYENKDSSMLAGTIRSTSNAPSSSTPTTTTSTTITSSSSSSSSTNNNNTDNRMIEEEEVLSIAVQGCNTPSSTSSDATLGNENNNNNQQKRSFLLLSSLFDSSSLNSSSSTTSSSSMMMSREEETIRSSTSRSSTLAVATSNSHNNCIHSNIGVTLSPLLMSSSNLSNSNISTTVGTAITSTVNSSTMTVGNLDNSTIGTNINNEESNNSNEQDDEQMMTLNNNTTMEEEEIMMDNNNDVSVNDNLNEEEGIMHLVQKQKEEHDEKLIIPNEQMNCLNFPNFNDKLNVDIPNHYLCPITKLIMINPVKNMYNKIYEKEGIEQWWKTLQNKNQKLTDPLTNQIITDKTLTEELSLREEIQLFLQQNLTLKFSMNEIYFPKQFIREMKVAIDGNDLEKVKKLLIQFPISFFIQTKFPVPTSGKHASNGSTSSGKNSEKETAVSIFDCLYKRFKYLHDRNNLKSNNNLMVNDYLQDPIIYFVMNQFLIVKNYLNNNLTICNNKNNDNIEIKTTIHAMNDGLKNIFVNSIRLFPNKYLLDWFLSLGAPLHSVNQFKQNAFHMACMTDQLEIASYLLEMVNLKQQQSNNQLCSAMIEERLSDDVKKKWNAFQLAIWHQSDKIIDWMINSEELISKFIIKKPKCLVRDKSGIFHPMNALSLSSYKKNIKLMEVLINKFNYNLCDDKYHPIYWSCIASDLDGFKWICNFIKENIGIDKLILQLKGINDRAFKRSLIHAISMEASDEMMDYYLNLCSELNIIDSIINVQDNFGNTALHYACEKSRTKMIESLIQNGIAHEYFNKQGKTAVQCCKTEEDRDTIQKAIRKERELLKNVLVKVKELETDVQWLKRKLMEMESNDVKKTKME